MYFQWHCLLFYYRWRNMFYIDGSNLNDNKKNPHIRVMAIMELAVHFGQMKAIRCICSKCFQMRNIEYMLVQQNLLFTYKFRPCTKHFNSVDYPFRDLLFFKIKSSMTSSSFKLYIPQFRPRYIYIKKEKLISCIVILCKTACTQ